MIYYVSFTGKKHNKIAIMVPPIGSLIQFDDGFLQVYHVIYLTNNDIWVILDYPNSTKGLPVLLERIRHGFATPD